MSSNLRVDRILPSTGTEVGVGTATGSVALYGDVNIAGTLTYEDITNIDSVGIVTAGSGLHVTSGNLAIGHSNPTYMLHLKTYGNNEIVLNNTRGSSLGAFGLYDNHLEVNALSNHPLLLKTNSVERLRITSGGNIGVAGVTGTDYSLLDGMVINTANGSAGLLINSSSSSHNAYLGFSYGSGSGTSHADQYSAYIGRVGDNKLILGTNNTIRLNIDSSGRVGIQGDPTRALLEVRASGGSNTMLTALWGANEGTTTGALSDNTDKAVRMGIQHYDTDALPYAFLVGSSTSSANNLTFGGGTGLMNAATEILFRTASNTTTTTGTERLRITSDGTLRQSGSSGALGQGTSVAKLTHYTIDGTTPGGVGDVTTLETISATSNGSDYKFIITKREGSGGGSCFINLGGNSDGSISFGTNTSGSGTERLRITSDGKVGINEASPTARLDINHPHTEQGLVVRSRYGNIATAMVKFDGDPDSNGGDGNVLHLHGGSSRTDSEILHIDSTGVGDIFDIRGDGLTRVYKQLQLEHSSNVAKIIFNEYGANDIKAQIEMDQVSGSSGQLIFRTQDSGTLSERLRIESNGKVLINVTNSGDNKAKLVVDGTVDCGSIVTGRVHDSTNSNNRTVLLHRMNTSQGFQFSGDIMVNSWTGNAKVDCHITVRYNDQSVEVDVINATHSSQISKSQLRVVTADYGSNRYLGIQKNGGGTGVFYLNAFVGTNIDNSGNGGIREVNNSSLGSVTSHGNLN